MNLNRDEIFAWFKGPGMLNTVPEIKFVCRCVEKFYELKRGWLWPDREEVIDLVRKEYEEQNLRDYEELKLQLEQRDELEPDTVEELIKKVDDLQTKF